MILTAQYLRSALHYDPDTGVFTWRERTDMPPKWNGKWTGKQAGWTALGYRRINVNSTTYQAHRLAWLYMTGKWPAADIDHMDCDTLNNRWRNLRSATRSQNNCNSKRRSDNKSGFKGVSRKSTSPKLWLASIAFEGKRRSLGLFATPEEAHAAYVAASAKIHGEFAKSS